MRYLSYALAAFASVLLTPGSTHAAAPCGDAKSDFLVRSDPHLAPVHPVDCSTTTQSPPEFVWPPQGGKNTYTLQLTFPDGRTESRETADNWLLWDRALPPGTYT